ncbi:MAG: hypothetical protein KDE58_27130, partial [Caldilineaceae bacterium]|nr:hypothetical protein [Caldilineaceae bacterium]
QMHNGGSHEGEFCQSARHTAIGTVWYHVPGQPNKLLLFIQRAPGYWGAPYVWHCGGQFKQSFPAMSKEWGVLVACGVEHGAGNRPVTGGK